MAKKVPKGKFKNCTCVDIPEEAFHKISAILIKEKRLLVVRERGMRGFIAVGGKHDRGESHEENLKKEIREELQLNYRSSEFFGRFQDIAYQYKVPVVMDTYLVDFWGEPYPDSEIKEYKWINKNYKKENINMGSVLEKFVIPKLVVKGLL
jgi:8-oxo-dGTP pyrophosphatase MutT (NUDIX family)